MIAAIGDGSFASGTRIAVPEEAGASPSRRIEDLAPGDLVATAGGGVRTVMRIAKRQVDVAGHAAPPRVTPVRLRAHSLGQGRPARDLLLPPEALLFFHDSGDDEEAAAPDRGFLVPAAALANGASIAREPAAGVFTWYTLDLDGHDVVLAENAAVGSHREGGPGDAGGEEWGGEKRPREKTCARLLLPGPELAGLRARLAALPPPDSAPPVIVGAGDEAEPDPTLAVIHDPARPVRLFVDGEEIAGAPGRDAGAFVYLLPEGCGPARLISASGDSPAESDTRRLGVCVVGLELDGTELDLGGPAAGPGFHPIESDQGGNWRWTDGRAWLVLPHSANRQRLTVRINDWHLLTRR